MGTSVALGRACGRCGEQVTLSVTTDGGTYTDDLTALLNASHRDKVIVQADCGCPRPRKASFQSVQITRDEIKRE